MKNIDFKTAKETFLESLKSEVIRKQHVFEDGAAMAISCQSTYTLMRLLLGGKHMPAPTVNEELILKYWYLLRSGDPLPSQHSYPEIDETSSLILADDAEQLDKMLTAEIREMRIHARDTSTKVDKDHYITVFELPKTEDDDNIYLSGLYNDGHLLRSTGSITPMLRSDQFLNMQFYRPFHDKTKMALVEPASDKETLNETEWYCIGARDGLFNTTIESSIPLTDLDVTVVPSLNESSEKFITSPLRDRILEEVRLHINAVVGNEDDFFILDANSPCVEERSLVVGDVISVSVMNNKVKDIFKVIHKDGPFLFVSMVENRVEPSIGAFFIMLAKNRTTSQVRELDHDRGKPEHILTLGGPYGTRPFGRQALGSREHRPRQRCW